MAKKCSRCGKATGKTVTKDGKTFCCDQCSGAKKDNPKICEFC